MVDCGLGTSSVIANSWQRLMFCADVLIVLAVIVTIQCRACARYLTVLLFSCELTQVGLQRLKQMKLRNSTTARCTASIADTIRRIICHMSWVTIAFLICKFMEFYISLLFLSHKSKNVTHTDKSGCTSISRPLPSFLYHVSWDYRFYRAMVCVGAVFAVARCRSVCHVGVLYPDCWIYRQTSFSVR